MLVGITLGWGVSTSSVFAADTGFKVPTSTGDDYNSWSTHADKYLTIPNVAELLGLSRVAVYFQVQKGKIPAIKIGGEYLIEKNIITQIDEPKQEEHKKEISKKYYSVAEISAMFGINRQTVARKIKEGQIPATRVGRHYVIDQSVVDEGIGFEDVTDSVENEDYISVMDLAKQLGISRIAVFKKIKQGKIQAIKIGRSYAINRHELRSFLVDVG
jgi:excisionase family DNA binding protein